MKTIRPSLDPEAGNVMTKTFHAWRTGACLHPLGGLALATLLLAACGSGAVADNAAHGSAASPEGPALRLSTANVERLGLMRAVAADVDSHSDWDDWFTKQWQPEGGTPAAFDAVRLTCPEGDCTVAEHMEVSSCALLFEADSKDLDVEGMEAPQGGYLYRRLVCYAGVALAAMRDANVSHVSDFVLDPETLMELPAELGYPDSPLQLEEARRLDDEGGRLAAFLEQVAGIAEGSLVQTHGEGLRIDDGELWTREWLLLGRGDIDGDGVEDLLIGVNLYITDEALRFGSRLYAVTRDEAGGALRMVYEVPIRGGCSEDAKCAEFLLPAKR